MNPVVATLTAGLCAGGIVLFSWLVLVDVGQWLYARRGRRLPWWLT